MRIALDENCQDLFFNFRDTFCTFLHEPTTSVRISPSWYVYQKQGVFLALSYNTKGMLLKRKRSGNYDLTWRLNYDNYCTCALIYGEEIATSFFLQDFFPFFTGLFCLFFCEIIVAYPVYVSDFSLFVFLRSFIR